MGILEASIRVASKSGILPPSAGTFAEILCHKLSLQNGRSLVIHEIIALLEHTAFLRIDSTVGELPRVPIIHVPGSTLALLF